MTESARGQPIVESGLKGHLCSRLGPRRSDLFRRQRDLPMQPGGESSFPCVSVSFKARLSVAVSLVVLGGGQELAVGLLTTPDRPDDASQLVGDGDGGLVVDVGLAQLVRPLAESVWLFGAGVEQDRAGAVDQQGPQVTVTALGDASQVAL